MSVFYVGSAEGEFTSEYACGFWRVARIKKTQWWHLQWPMIQDIDKERTAREFMTIKMLHLASDLLGLSKDIRLSP